MSGSEKLIELMQEELDGLHKIFLEILDEVDRICRKYHIEYSLDGGTMLGAVRDHGFIPWDDDADIVFTRDQYRKFYAACKKELDTDRFFLQEYRTDKAYPWGYSKIRRLGTELIQPGQEHIPFHKGIYIDVFVDDPVPDGYIARRVNYFLCFCIRKCQYAVMGKLSAKSRFMRWWYSKLDKVPKDLLFASLNFLAAKTNKKTELVSHRTWPFPGEGNKYGLPSDLFDEYMDVDFEGRNYRIVKDYDRYLRRLYGDYMTLPPEDKRKPKLPRTFMSFDISVSKWQG